jgi:exodeoxyribonuclease V alpha subunit
LPRLAAEWAAVRLPRALRVAPDAVQTLAPLTRVCQAVNELLQVRLNPPRGQAERPHGALPLRVGDRVIQTRNNYDLGVFNGDTGTVLAVAPDSLTVDFGDGRAVAYRPADLIDLDHAYCLTVHRAQGSEWPGVVLLISSAYGPILSRNLLYTALTRARRAIVILGDAPAIARAVAETRDQERCTGLAALLAQADGVSPLPLGEGQGGCPLGVAAPRSQAATPGSPRVTAGELGEVGEVGERGEVGAPTAVRRPPSAVRKADGHR